MIHQNIKESSSYKPVETMFNGPGTYYVRPRDTSIEDSWDISSKENFERFLKDHPEYSGCTGYKQTTFSHGDSKSNRRGEYWTEKEEMTEKEITYTKEVTAKGESMMFTDDISDFSAIKQFVSDYASPGITEDDCTIRHFESPRTFDIPIPGEKKEVNETDLVEDETTEDPFLDSTIDVYDIDAFIKSESNNTLQSFHFHNGGAIILKSDGSGCLVDFEAIGTRFNNVNDEITIDTTEFDQDKRVIYVLPDSIIKTTAKEIMDKAPKRSVKVKDFFTKYQYNDRCERNFYDLRKFLNESMEESDESFEYIYEYFPVDDKETLNNTIEELKKENRYVKHEQVGEEIAVYARWASPIQDAELTESYDMNNVVDDMLADIKDLLKTVKSQNDPQIMVSSIVTALEGIIKRAEENIKEAW